MYFSEEDSYKWSSCSQWNFSWNSSVFAFEHLLHCIYWLWALCSYLWSLILPASGSEILWSNYCLYFICCEFHICWCCFEYFLLFFLYIYLSIFFSGVLGERGSKYTCSAHHLIHYPNCIQSSPMKTFIQKMDSSSVANPSWSKTSV